MALGDNVEVDSGSFTPESMKLRRRLAESMLQQGMQTGPIGHWSQGASRILQAMLGGWQMNQLEKKEKAQTDEGNAALLGLLGEGAAAVPAVSPAPTTGAVSEGVATVAQGATSGQPQTTSVVDGDFSPYREAVAKIESGGEKEPYKAVGQATRTGDRAYGKYQVMGDNIPTWTKEVLGVEMTPQQFLLSPASQDAVFDAKFGASLKKHGNPQDAASVWFTGRPLAKGGDSRAKTPGGVAYGPTGNQYVDAFTKNLGAATPSNGTTPAQASPVAAAGGAGGGAASVAPNVDPATRQQIGKLLSNPATRPFGLAMIQKIALDTPKIVEVETVDRFGRTVKIPATFNPATKTWERVQVGVGGGGAAPQLPMTGQVPVQLPAQMPAAPQVQPQPITPQMPRVVTPNLDAEVPISFGGQTVVRGGKEDMAPSSFTPQMMPASAAAPVAPQQTAQVQPQVPAQTAQRFYEFPVNVNTLPKPQEGYTYDLGPNNLPQFDEQFNPKMIAQKDLETRATLNAKRGEGEITKNAEALEQINGVKAIVGSARALREQPGFAKALEMGRSNFDIGANIGGAQVGINPGQIAQQFQRMTDANNPAWGVMDDIKATQERLKAVVARPLFKGQGAVSNMERQMITDMIGELPKASNPADFQFRLNSIENMIEDMYARPEGKSVSAEELPRHLARKQKQARPSRDELSSLTNAKDDPTRTQLLENLAGKYNISPLDMLQHWMTAAEFGGGK